MINYAELDDLALQSLVSVGDTRAEDTLTRRYMSLIDACAASMKLSGGEKKDLVQEGYFGLRTAIRHFDSTKGASFSGFARRCIRNRMISVIKSASRLKHFPLNNSISLEQLSEESNPHSSAVLEASHSNPEDMVLARESKEELFTALSDSLSKYEYRVLVYYLNGRSYQEIGEQLGKDAKSVDNAVQRIRRKLARNLNLGDISSR
ncbi:MAG: sigma-70 family RNA polymerase sigma factor [Oscillospiraceae bacterium]|nr:sigma-70 family RNA polymerase sigma factor [Oscillospiraceae bacterium]